MNTNYEHTWVFLSHSNQDFKILRKVRNRLEELNFRPLLFFLKCLEDDDEIFDLIKREIEARERFILCKSTNSLNSPWVQKEVDYIKALGRPYVTIDLEAPLNVINERINRFDQRSTVYIWSTDDNVADEVLGLAMLKALKVKMITKSDLGKSLAVQHELLDGEILRGAYFMAIVTRELKKEECSFLNRFASRFRLNAIAYQVGNHIDNNSYWDSLKDNVFHRKINIEGVDNSIIANAIVDDLLSSDARSFNGEPSKNDLFEKRQRIDKKDFAKRLRIYIDSHREGDSLKPISKSSHKTWLDDSAFRSSVKKDYFDRLNLNKLLELINKHASKKGLHFATVYDCTDLEILLWVFEELLVVDKKGSMSSALYYYIVHLLEANGIIISR